MEQSPVASSSSDGLAERAVQTIEGQIRVMKLALEGRLGTKLEAEAKVVSFMAEYAAYLTNRLEVGKDGKTAYQRSKGKSATVLGIEYGEKILYKVKAKAKMNKIYPMWAFGIFVGVRSKSGELWVDECEKFDRSGGCHRRTGGRWTASIGSSTCLGTSTGIRRTRTGTFRRTMRWTYQVELSAG